MHGWILSFTQIYFITTTIFGFWSNNIRQELSSFVRHKAVVNVKLRCFQSTRKLQSWFSIKDRQALLNRFNVVYKLTCSCGASYIGQTQRNLINRIEEHLMFMNWNNLLSDCSEHVRTNLYDVNYEPFRRAPNLKQPKLLKWYTILLSGLLF